MTNEQLVESIRSGEAHYIDTLLEQNRGFLHHIARRYMEAARRNRGLDYEDLTQAAAEGLIGAIPAWDAERGSFIIFAAFGIATSIRDALGMRTKKKRIENEEPTLLSSPVGEEGEDCLLDLIADPEAADPQEGACDMDLCRIVREAVARLPEAQREAIQGFYLDGCTLGSIAERHGVTTEAISQHKARGERSLRRNVRLVRLWREYEAAPYRPGGLKAWKYTHTSSTEAAAIRREWLAGLMCASMQ